MGLSPRSANKSDEMWFLAGARVPFLLRKNTDDYSYALIVESFVHGIMYDELSEMYESRPTSEIHQIY
jgi:hypothetical protein